MSTAPRRRPPSAGVPHGGLEIRCSWLRTVPISIAARPARRTAAPAREADVVGDRSARRDPCRSAVAAHDSERINASNARRPRRDRCSRCCSPDGEPARSSGSARLTAVWPPNCHHHAGGLPPPMIADTAPRQRFEVQACGCSRNRCSPSPVAVTITRPHPAAKCHRSVDAAVVELDA